MPRLYCRHVHAVWLYSSASTSKVCAGVSAGWIRPPLWLRSLRRLDDSLQHAADVWIDMLRHFLRGRLKLAEVQVYISHQVRDLAITRLRSRSRGCKLIAR